MSKFVSTWRAAIAASGVAMAAWAIASRTYAQAPPDAPRMSVLTVVTNTAADSASPEQIKFTYEITNLSEDIPGNSMISFTIGAGLLDGIIDGKHAGNIWVATWQPVFHDHSVTFYADPLNLSYALDPGWYPGVLSVYAASYITVVDGVATATASGNASVTNRFNEVPIKVPRLIPQLEPVTLAGASYRNGVFSAAFNTRSNRLYTVWMNTDLRATNWTVLAQYPGESKTVSFSDTNSADQARYYRVETGVAKP